MFRPKSVIATVIEGIVKEVVIVGEEVVKEVNGIGPKSWTVSWIGIVRT